MYVNLDFLKNSQLLVTRLTCIIWKLWTKRCKRVFDAADYANDEIKLWNHIVSSTNKFLRANINIARSSKSSFLIWWNPLPNGFLKMNIDRACLWNPGIAGPIDLLRNEGEKWILGFVDHLGVCTSVAAELFAIRTGLSLAWYYDYNTIVCEVDAQAVLQLIVDGDMTIHPLGSIIKDI
ncbi:hypothetical protein F3Y22_tig00111273pilonHSYRG00171 [Hibiscus syriacus]|uniref:RNase H type-1 domain-containing protein n=1 Tax=Hibiscus syriacus TaxID=106335 RepID=A0A6A2YS52_HIBSY|nr:hypothetical protein F3Y22_tig00111273pilonHSYRG00171 [Hibiscus syriacus]